MYLVTNSLSPSIGLERTAKIRVGCQVWMHKSGSGPYQVYLMQIGEIPHCFSSVQGNMLIGSRAIDWVAIFRTCSPSILYNHTENDRVNMQKTVDFCIRTLTRYCVEYLTEGLERL